MRLVRSSVMLQVARELEMRRVASPALATLLGRWSSSGAVWAVWAVLSGRGVTAAVGSD